MVLQQETQNERRRGKGRKVPEQHEKTELLNSPLALAAQRPKKTSPPDTDIPADSIPLCLAALWKGATASVYFAAEINTIVVRHHAAPCSRADARYVMEFTQTLRDDLRLMRPVLDLRLADSHCKCSLCEMPTSCTAEVVCIRRDAKVHVEKVGQQEYGDFAEAISSFERADVAVPGYKALCGALKAGRAQFVYGNYVGALYCFASDRTAYIHWSGNDQEASGFGPLMTALCSTADRIPIETIIVDARNRTFTPKVASNLISAQAISLWCKGLRRFFTVGADLEGGPGAVPTSFSTLLESGAQLAQFPTLAAALKSLSRLGSEVRRRRSAGRSSPSRRSISKVALAG